MRQWSNKQFQLQRQESAVKLIPGPRYWPQQIQIVLKSGIVDMITIKTLELRAPY